MLTGGLALGPSEGVPMAHSASTQAMADGSSLTKAECMLAVGDAQGAGLWEVLAAAAASSSAGESSASKGEEGTWLVTPLTVTSRGLSRQGAGAQEAASKGPAPEGEEGTLRVCKGAASNRVRSESRWDQ